MINEKYIEDVIETIINYRDKHGWQKNDTLINLSKSIFIEAAELFKNYASYETAFDQENIKEELADILMYSLTLCHELKYDIYNELLRRLAQ